ncbi:transposase [Endomicrobium sp. AH-315-J14]|nr:transposase [Endomicrobium sp. AH-315-J14]
MSGGAAQLIDGVAPHVRFRQWVVSVPFELRLLLASRAEALTAVGRIAVQEIVRWQREQARADGLEDARSGALSWNQRFGGSLNLNVHFHIAVPDGVFTRVEAGAPAGFHPLRPPNSDDLTLIAARIHARSRRWLRKRGMLRDDDAENDEAQQEVEERSALQACLEGSVGIGELTSVDSAAGRGGAGAIAADTDAQFRRRSGVHVGEAGGFNIHAGVVLVADDREGLERLFRYCGRPPLSLERMTELVDGRIAYRLRHPSRRGETHRVMTPLQFLARVCALIPPPRHPLLRFYGVFAPNSSWRADVVPSSDVASPPVIAKLSNATTPTTACTASAVNSACVNQGSPRACIDDPSIASPQPIAPSNSAPPARACSAEECSAPTCLTATSTSTTFVSSPHTPMPAHSCPARIDWAMLLARVYDVDALACPCGGRLRFIATITEPATARRILEAVGLPSEPPSFTPADTNLAEFLVPP